MPPSSIDLSSSPSFAHDLRFELADALFEARDVVENRGKLRFQRLGRLLKRLTNFIPSQFQLASDLLTKPFQLCRGGELPVVFHPLILVQP